MSNPDTRRQTPDAPRILVRGTNWLGDAVMTTPALMRLREKFPSARITLLTPEKLAELWKNHPAVNETISFAPGESIFSVGRKLRRWGERTGEPLHEPKNEVTTTRADARPTGFDLALVLPNSPRSAIETWLAGIPRRVGYARPWRNYFLTQAVAPRPDAGQMRKRSVSEIRQLVAADVNRRMPRENRTFTSAATNVHQIHEYLHLTAALGANPEPLPPQLFVSPDEIETSKKKFGLEKTTQPVFGLNPGAEYGPAKRWPVDRFIAAARQIQQQTNCVWLIFGGKNDVIITDQIESALLAASERSGDGRTPNSALRNLAGQTTLRDLMAMQKFCRVLLTNDSGPMHVAAALGTPVVVPFGSTSPELTGPGLPGDSRHRLLKSDAPCSPCFRRECPIDLRCMNGITIERVVEAVLSALRG
ncbi:MAG TPA: lipopolysaccharide heptosyltransferase II [Verrucomicrobiae bacterium]|nr:lipopolysaccharide heptosyltransferase II [Verrucomicrobiae bacterium]